MGDRGTANSIHSLEQDILTGFVVMKQKGKTVVRWLETAFPIVGAGSGHPKFMYVQAVLTPLDLGRAVAIDTKYLVQDLTDRALVHAC